MQAHSKPLFRWHPLIFHWQTHHTVKPNISGSWKCTLPTPAGEPEKVIWQRLWIFNSVSGRECRIESRHPISHRAYDGCLEVQVSYHGDIFNEKKETEQFGLEAGRLFLCYCHFDVYFLIFILQAKIWTSVIFTSRLNLSLGKLKLQDHEHLSLAGSSKAKNMSTLNL